MAHPPYHTFAKNSLGAGLGVDLNAFVPHDRAISEIQNHSLLMIQFMPYVTAADPRMNFPSSHALLDLLSWLANTVFPNALRRYPLATQVQEAWNQAANAVLGLQAQIRQMAALRQPAAYVPNDGPRAPSESALELIYTSILMSVSPTNFDSGWEAIDIIPFLGNPNSRGMPMVGMLCLGLTANLSVRRFVVTTNVSRWQGLEHLGTWATDARKNSLPNGYVESVKYLSEKLIERGHLINRKPDPGTLRGVWKESKDAQIAGLPVVPDEELQRVWTQLCNENPPINGPRIFTRPRVLTALAFDCCIGRRLDLNLHTGLPPRERPGLGLDEGIPPRERCVRCRVLFRFNMRDDSEPNTYEKGPFRNRLSCAEVAAFDKCRRYGL